MFKKALDLNISNRNISSYMTNKHHFKLRGILNAIVENMYLLCIKNNFVLKNVLTGTFTLPIVVIWILVNKMKHCFSILSPFSYFTRTHSGLTSCSHAFIIPLPMFLVGMSKEVNINTWASHIPVQSRPQMSSRRPVNLIRILFIQPECSLGALNY